MIGASDSVLGDRFLYCEGDASLLFTENENNTERLVGVPNRTPFVKDGINNYIVHDRRDAVNPEKTGTKAAIHYSLTVGGGESKVVRLRLNDATPAASVPTRNESASKFGEEFENVMESCRREAEIGRAHV